MRIRTALIGFAVAGLTVVGTATTASAHSFAGYHADMHSHNNTVVAGHGMVAENLQGQGGSESGFTAGE
ncbi:hypothetical protein [Kitasatospora sp. GAS204B]|uniref:hypothetical protein n=1 Tax=unclassified Kitasatospora TaxID=2633591 RepID=UPI0024755974|nr:hypothetical protein [Kitasatospora sp. GAS204B]MDH6121128.1 hypothetical protein [Kitasatospora sp. GAS204B]